MAIKWKEQKFKAGDEALSVDFPDYEIYEHTFSTNYLIKKKT